jgi:hypothetical protein
MKKSKTSKRTAGQRLRAAHGWVACAVKMPPLDAKVLGWDGRSHIVMRRWKEDGKMHECGECMTWPCTHWMPLPKPPNVQSERQEAE